GRTPRPGRRRQRRSASVGGGGGSLHQAELWFAALPPLSIYLLLGIVIGAESMGIPLPGEIALVTAALLASAGVTDPWLVGLAASAGAIVGDSIGYSVGR